MKLSKVSKKINVLKGEISDLQNRIDGAMRTLEGNEFPEELTPLADRLDQKIKRLIALKTARMKANVDYDIYKTILQLGEAKSQLHWLNGLDVSSGKTAASRFGDTKTVAYISQMTVEHKQEKMDELRASIEEMVDMLDDFNGAKDIKV